MKNIGIIAFNSASKTEKMLNCDFLEYINLHVQIKGEEYLDKTIEELDTAVKEYNEIPKTSQPTTKECIDAFEKNLDKYEKLIVLTPAQDLSGTHQNIILSKKMIEEAKQKRIYVVETKSFAISEALLSDTAIDLINANKEVEEIMPILEEKAQQLTTYIIPGSLDYLKKSGRVNLAQLAIGRLMMLRLLVKHKKGIATVHRKGRGFKNLLKQVIEELEEYDNIDNIYISGLAPDLVEYEELKKILEKRIEVQEAKVGSIIMAAHFGANTLGFLILGTRKEELC